MNLLLGVGNAWRRDDGVGLAVVDEIERLDGRMPGLRIERLDGEPARLLDAWDGADLAVVVDGVRSGAAPGTVRRFGPGDEMPGAGGGGTHTLGVGEALRLGRALGRLPRRLVVIGVEVADVRPGSGLSDAVACAVPEAVELAREELQRHQLKGVRGRSCGTPSITMSTRSL